MHEFKREFDSLKRRYENDFKKEEDKKIEDERQLYKPSYESFIEKHNEYLRRYPHRYSDPHPYDPSKELKWKLLDEFDKEFNFDILFPLKKVLDKKVKDYVNNLQQKIFWETLESITYGELSLYDKQIITFGQGLGIDKDKIARKINQINQSTDEILKKESFSKRLWGFIYKLLTIKNITIFFIILSL